MTAAVALVLAIAPAGWMAELLDVASADATAFLTRRYAASATAALFVVTIAVMRGGSPRRAGLLALATWFAVQGVVAVVGLVSGTVGGLAWAAVLADPLLAAWFLVLARNVQRDSSHAGDLPHGGDGGRGDPAGRDGRSRHRSGQG
jgi:hypothetical protein